MAQEGSIPTFKSHVSESPYAQALESNPFDVFSEIQSTHPDLFDASHPLAFGNAQNTAQSSKDKSEQLQEAHGAITSGDFMQNLTKSFQGFNQSMKNSTANIAPYGFHSEDGHQVRNIVTKSSPMPAQGLPVSKYDPGVSKASGNFSTPDWLTKKRQGK